MNCFSIYSEVFSNMVVVSKEWRHCIDTYVHGYFQCSLTMLCRNFKSVTSCKSFHKPYHDAINILKRILMSKLLFLIMQHTSSVQVFLNLFMLRCIYIYIQIYINIYIYIHIYIYQIILYLFVVRSGFKCTLKSSWHLFELRHSHMLLGHCCCLSMLFCKRCLPIGGHGECVFSISIFFYKCYAALMLLEAIVAASFSHVHSSDVRGRTLIAVDFLNK